MDVIRELQRIIEEMEKGEQHSSLMATVDQPNPPPSPPSSPPPVFAELGINPQLQSAERQGEEYGDFITLGADLHLPNLQPVNGVPTTAAVGHPAAAAAAAAAAAPPPPQSISTTKVDVIEELEQIIEEMERREPVPTLMETANSIFARANAPNPPSPPPSLPPPVYAGLENITQPQLAERHCDCTPLGAIPHTVEQQSSWMAAPTMNEGVLYKVPEGHFALPVPAVPPLNTSSSKKRKREKEQSNERPYVKKPLNAFMLFLKEHRAKAGAELQGRGSAAINTVLGQIWNSLTKEEQAKYFRQAETERVLHAQRHPEWSPSDNFLLHLNVMRAHSRPRSLVCPHHVNADSTDTDFVVITEIEEQGSHQAPTRAEGQKEEEIEEQGSHQAPTRTEGQKEEEIEEQGSHQAPTRTEGQKEEEIEEQGSHQAPTRTEGQKEEEIEEQGSHQAPTRTEGQKEEEIEEQGSHQAPTRTEGQKEEEIEEQGSHQAPTRTEGQKEEEIEEQGSHQAPTRLPPGLKLLHLNVMRAHSRPTSLVCSHHVNADSTDADFVVITALDVHTVLVPEAPHTQTVQVQQPNTQTATTVHVPVHHLPQLCEVSPTFTLVSPETASMSLASPAAPTKEEQAKYFHQAETERVLHAQRHPEWSPSDNFVSPTCSYTTHTSIHTE
ncbi:hypothetical protein ABVT39_002726 [Epinephelus coioides]